MFQSIDKLFDRCWAFVVQKFCQTTGLTNFFLARSLGTIGGVGIVLSEFLRTIENGPDPFGLTGILFVWIFTIPWLFTFTSEMEKGYESNQSTMNATISEMSFVVANRLVFTIVGVFWVASFSEPELAIRGIAEIAIGGGFYCATHSQGIGTSLVKRAVKWGKGRLPRIQPKKPLPVPAPS